jgi:hypothetical protein
VVKCIIVFVHGDTPEMADGSVTKVRPDHSRGR